MLMRLQHAYTSGQGTGQRQSCFWYKKSNNLIATIAHNFEEYKMLILTADGFKNQILEKIM